MADTDLFMECEEEELEPWQQMHETMREQEYQGAMKTINSVASAVPTTLLAAAALPPPSLPLARGGVMPAALPSGTAPAATAHAKPPVATVTAAAPSPLPPGQQLILAQGGAGLGTVALSQVLIPATTTGAANNQPIFITTQGLPVQNLQAGQSPVGIVLNVQQGRTVRPITLVQAAGPQIFKPAVAGTPILNQTPQTRPSVPAAPRGPTPTGYAAVRLPAAFALHGTAPSPQTPAPTTTAAGGRAVTSALSLPPNTQTKIVTLRPGEALPNLQNVVNILKTVPSSGAPAQTILVIGNQNRKPNGLGSSSVPALGPVPQLSVVQTAAPVTYAGIVQKFCPRCGAQFKMLEALRSHMCFCCPDLVQSSGSSSNNSAPVGQTPPAQPAALAPALAPPQADQSEEVQDRLVMLVDDFYYGTFEGHRVYVARDHAREPSELNCSTCFKKLKNNIRLMNHLMHHVELEQQQGAEHAVTCHHCFRRFPTPFRLQSHIDTVHIAEGTAPKCKICEWSFESEPVFLQHMKNTHKPGEMPYVCQVCEYRSSFYSDVFNHFRTWHEDTRHLLCVYCLRVFKSASSYQQHFRRHQRATVYGCNRCRLQFLFSKDKMEHKLSHHKTYRKPRQLEGLSPGTKVTIRAHAGPQRPLPLGASRAHDPKPSGRPAAMKKPVSKMFNILSKFQEQRWQLGRQRCLECTFDIPDFSNHFPTYVHCSLCVYSTCCSRAYANHMIKNHVSRKNPKAPTKRPLSWFRVTCDVCGYSTQQGDQMATHLGEFPGHSSYFTLNGNPRIGLRDLKRTSNPPDSESVNNQEEPLCGSASAGPVMAHQESSCLVQDDEMAPLEDEIMEMEDDQQLRQEEQENITGRSIPENEKPKLVREDPVVSVTSKEAVKEREENLSVRHLRIMLFALCCGDSNASKSLATEPRVICSWLREKRNRLRSSKGTSGGKAVERLVEWVLVQREQQRPITEKNLFLKASQIHSQVDQVSSFRISYDWAVGFMLQHDLGLQPRGTLRRKFPHHMEDNCRCFTEFVHKQIETYGFDHSSIAAMDELFVFANMDMLSDQATIDKEAALQVVGAGEPLVRIYLSVLADGTLLPTLLFFKGHPPERLREGLPDSIRLEARPEGFANEEELEHWTTQVWQTHLKSHNSTKAMLVMDGHRGHTTEESLSTVSGTGTLPAAIPAGCTGRLQPLEICIRPVLQTFLLSRWTKLANQGGAAGATANEVLELVVMWLVEALSCISSRPELVQHSFRLAGVIAEQPRGQSPGEAQWELIQTLTEALLGPEALQPEAPSMEDPGEMLDDAAMDRAQSEDIGEPDLLEVQGQSGEGKSDLNEDAAPGKSGHGLQQERKGEHCAQNEARETAAASSSPLSHSSSQPTLSHTAEIQQDSPTESST